MQLREKHKTFAQSKRKHILLITNHGCHGTALRVTTDTGGQNFYVNDLAKSALNLGYKVTILNRGGYKHPVTKHLQRGIEYYDEFWGKQGLLCRVMYLEDSTKAFVPKEKLKVDKNLAQERDFLFKQAKKIGMDLTKLHLISSHYWDAGILGVLINEQLEKQGEKKIPHVWTPHSLGILKRHNYKNAKKSIIKALNFPTRISNEERVIATVDGVTSTSGTIRKTFNEYKAKAKNHFWFPPGIDTKLFRPRTSCPRGVAIVADKLGKTKAETKKVLDRNVVIFEVSRTAKTKRKDLILGAFTKLKNIDDALLIMTVDRGTDEYDKVMDIYNGMKHKECVVLVDKVMDKEETAQLSSLADIYITASVMEGWGMSVQQAAASRSAIVSSKYVPLVNEVLKDSVIVVPKNDSTAYAKALDKLISSATLRKKLSTKAYNIIAGEYSWDALTKNFLTAVKKAKIIT